jgi:hypothetical protein
MVEKKSGRTFSHYVWQADLKALLGLSSCGGQILLLQEAWQGGGEPS